MDKWIFLKFYNLLNLSESWRKKLVSQMVFFVASLMSFKEGVHVSSGFHKTEILDLVPLNPFPDEDTN